MVVHVVVLVRSILAAIISFAMAYSGLKKQSLDISGCIAAVFVGFTALACSYRFGIILILFYYSSSKLTKYKSSEKMKIEEGHVIGGNRNYIQVFANSILATIVAIVYFFVCGEDENISFAANSDTNDVISFYFLQEIPRKQFAAICWATYIAHYATANGDTWASELGVLSKQKPRLVTSFFLREVPPGTNGGMSLLGTVASLLGGGFIGLIFWAMSFFEYSQLPMVAAGLLYGLLGSLVDSILGATLQASYYNKEKKLIVKSKYLPHSRHVDKDVILVSGIDFVTNEFVNFLSILIMMVLSLWLTPIIFCGMNKTHC